MPGDEILTQSAIPISTQEAVQIAQDLYGITGTASRLSGERDTNFRIDAGDRRYALKVANPAEELSVLEMQQLALKHLESVDPGLPVPCPVATASGSLVGSIDTGAGVTGVTLATFLAGVAMPIGPVGPVRVEATAASLVRLHAALVGFEHEATERVYSWDLTQATRLRPLLGGLGAERRQLATDWVGDFEQRISAVVSRLPRQAIHSDFNQENLLVDPSNHDVIVGIIDFGDLLSAPVVVDVAIAAAYSGLGTDDPARVAADLVVAYHEQQPLSGPAVEIAADLVIGRLVQSLTIGTWRAESHPENRDYILMHTEPVWRSVTVLAAERERFRRLILDRCL